MNAATKIYSKDEFYAECLRRLEANAPNYDARRLYDAVAAALVDGTSAEDIDDKLDLYEDGMDATRFRLDENSARAFGCTSIVAITKWQFDEDNEPTVGETLEYIFED